MTLPPRPGHALAGVNGLPVLGPLHSSADWARQPEERAVYTFPAIAGDRWERFIRTRQQRQPLT